MNKELELNINKQPDDFTCGPTCLHAIYQYYKLNISIDQIISEVKFLPDGGTLASHLGCHALEQGFRSKLFTFDIKSFDPTWFSDSKAELIKKLEEQVRFKSDPKFSTISEAYSQYIQKGGVIIFKFKIIEIIKKYLKQQTPILAGVSATYLYHCMRDQQDTMIPDDLKGSPSGHFVILTGIDLDNNLIHIADPYLHNPYSDTLKYKINAEHLISSILLGILTDDANLLVIK